MRKRSEVLPSAEDRTVPMFEEETPKSAFRKCPTCGVPLTETSLGMFLPCACLSNAAKKAPLNDKVKDLSPTNEELSKLYQEDSGSTVTVVWGEEKFTPVPNSYSTFTVGPFSVTTNVQPGETFESARERAMKGLREQAETERQRKCESFLSALKRMVDGARK